MIFSKFQTFLFLVFISLEELFYKYGVDLVFTGHEHSYERMYPVYNLEVIQHDYFNARAPIYIVTGTAGCNEKDGECFSPMRQEPGLYHLFSMQ